MKASLFIPKPKWRGLFAKTAIHADYRRDVEGETLRYIRAFTAANNLSKGTYEFRGKLLVG